ncbi:MAG: peptidoglycan bridge formation glycyltransferase FemA/FemB family protein, partial [Patescibacteria group bacterium]
LPLGQTYGYVPRGPALDNEFFDSPEKVNDLFKTIRAWVRKNFQGLVFLRLEPPISGERINYGSAFTLPDYYIQPKHNLAINLNQTEEEILAKFHPSTRSNVKKAERKGVIATVKKEILAEDWDDFFAMAKETVARNGGKNIYPGRDYFETMLKTLPHIDTTKENELAFCFFEGRQEGEPAAMNLVLFFGKTATYLFGASATAKLPSKVTTYLHWYSLKEAKKRGYQYYDLGGIDEKLWPSLTVFKRRFGGEEFEYAGNVDIVVNIIKYKIYNWIRKIKK